MECHYNPQGRAYYIIFKFNNYIIFTSMFTSMFTKDIHKLSIN